MEDLPTLEPVEEIMATSVPESLDSDLEEDIEENPEEVIEPDEDPNETFELPENEKPSQPPIELMPYLLGLDMLS